MNKNIKRMFFVLTLVTLLATVGAVCAADDANSTAAVDSSVSDVATVSETASDTVAVEPATTTSDDNKVDTKTIKKEEKNIKTSTKTVEVNNTNELTTTLNDAIIDTENEEYIINLNEGTYTLTSNTIIRQTSPIEKNIIINANNQILNASSSNRIIQFYNTSTNITINNATLNHAIQIYNISMLLNNVIINQYIQNSIDAVLTINNSTLNNSIKNNVKVIISDDCIFGENFSITGSGEIIINDSSRILPYQSTYNGTYTFKNMNITNSKTNYGNLTIINSTVAAGYHYNYGNLSLYNSTLNSSINNYGIIIISDDCIIGDNFILDGNGTVIINDTNRLAPYLKYYNGTYTLENMNITSQKINYGNLTVKNGTITYAVSNNGNMTVIDSNGKFGNNGNILILNSNITQLSNNGLSANMTVINSTINTTSQIMNSGSNLNISNSTITNGLNNDGEKVILNNVTINGYIRNNVGSVIIISDDTIFESGTRITNQGEIIINDTNRITPYLEEYNGNYTLKNINITSSKRNNGNLSIINCTLNTSITNSGVLIISDDTIIGENTRISGAGTIIINDTDRILPYLNAYNGNYTINNTVLTGYKTNYAYLTINNTEINAQLTNNGELSIYNSIITQAITNSGLLEIHNSTINSTISTSDDLIIDDDCIFGENLIISGNGEVIINDTNRIIPYLQTLNGNYTFENIIISSTKTNNGNITFINSTLNSTITNNGILIISDDVILGENLKIKGSGIVIINDTDRIFPYLDAYNGDYTIENTTISTSKSNYGNLTINNCNITNSITNEGNLIFNNCYIGAMLNQIINNIANVTFNNCTINMTKYATGVIPIWLTNTGNATIREDTIIIEGRLNNRGNITYTELPKPKTYIVTNDTLNDFFQDDVDGKLTDIVNPGDTLDFQGTITRNHSLTINKPINIISSTQDAYVDLDTHAGSLMGESPGASFAINNAGSYTNVTGIYFHNTQLWLYNTHYVTLDNISAVVENQQVGSGVGQTSIRANSTYVTVKNSYIYTKNNGGSSSLVLAWGDYCNLINNTIQAEGQVGNLVYLTTWNVEIPEGVIANQYNKIINNTIIGPSTSAAICYAIALGGPNNLIEGNILNYTGSGITVQFGGGSLGMNETTLFSLGANIINNNKLYGCGIQAGDIITNNYIQDGTLVVNDDKIITNNTVYNMRVSGENSTVTDNTINNILEISASTGISTIIENNTAKIIAIPKQTTNITLTNNNITQLLNINGTNCTISHNNIITDNEYTITGRGKNNTITDNYLVSANKVGDKSISLDNTTNTIANNTPYETTLKINTTEFTEGLPATITASIYIGQAINTSINKGKVAFKVNGKTLKDANGKIIYAKVVNGTATIENYLVPEDWTKEGTTIQAIYTGSTQCEKLTSEKTNITVTPEELTLTTTTSPTQLTATLSDTTINTGKIVFKINGKTVKDANGKVIYAKVVNGTVSVDYTLPESYKAGNYTVTATFIASGYDKLVANTTMTVEN